LTAETQKSNLLFLSQFARFSIVGAAGFCVDAAVLYAAIYLLKSGPYIGRVISYLIAATFTWYLNRTITFPDSRSHHKWREWLRFLAYNGAGGVVNYSVYVCYLHSIKPNMASPIVGVALGACAGLAVNFTLSRYLVFRHTRTPGSVAGRT
jgi:putative flippase GtrA